MSINSLNAEDLDQFIGSEQRYRHSLVRSISYLDEARNKMPITAARTGCWMRSHWRRNSTLLLRLNPFKFGS